MGNILHDFNTGKYFFVKKKNENRGGGVRSLTARGK
jgi:hypothetical protein